MSKLVIIILCRSDVNVFPDLSYHNVNILLIETNRIVDLEYVM